MRSASTALKNYLFAATTDELLIADLYTITFLDGSITRLTTWEHDLTVGGNTFSSTSALVQPTKKSIKTGVDVSNMTLVLNSDTFTINGLALVVAARKGAFDRARVKWERLVMPTDGDTSLGTTIEFIGEVGTPIIRPIEVELPCLSDLWVLQQTQIPKRLIQASCPYDLFDTGCTLAKTSFATSKIIASGTTILKLVPSVAISQADGYFDEGTVTFTSGALNGVTATIRQHIGGAIYLDVPLDSAPSIGDTFSLYPGCDKTPATCNSKFSNLVNFGGMPTVPVPEASL